MVGYGKYPPAACSLCTAWEEGRADFFAYSVNRNEFLRNNNVSSGCNPSDPPGCGAPENPCHDNFYPDMKWCVDDCGAATHPHTVGNIFAGVYLDFLYMIGWNAAGWRVHEHLQDVNDSTTWANAADGNSFYDHLLQSDVDVDAYKKYQFEIGLAFRKHFAIEAGKCSAADNPEWNDDTPSSRNHPYVINSSTVAKKIFRSPAQSGLGSLGFQYDCDFDFWYFYGLQGESYVINTCSLASGVDTYLHILNRSGSEVAFNDNCSGETNCGSNPPEALASCITFTPSGATGGTGWYAIEVQQTNQVGVGAYRVQAKVKDDHADSAYGASPLPLTGDEFSGSFESAGDTDWFKIYTPTAGTLQVDAYSNPCGTDTVLDLYSQGLALLASNDDCPSCSCSPCPCGSGACACSTGSRIVYATTAGSYYFLKLRDYYSAQTGAWAIKATLSTSRDVADTKSGAWTIQEDASGLLGRRLASDFESGADVDWFKFWLNEGEFASVETYGLEPGCDTKMDLWDDGSNGYSRIPQNSAKGWMAFDDDGALEYQDGNGSTIEQYASHIQFVAPRAGYYFVRVRPYSTGTIGYYLIETVKLDINASSYPSFP
ncbi:MAG: hypothetical protein FJ109_12050 [Deltaproteobacteria bacterium]|nr:hypothetical protein [Deltaproteobacteria bacterium]